MSDYQKTDSENSLCNEKMKHSFKNLCDASDDVQEKTQSMIRRKPFVSLVITFFVGFIVNELIRLLFRNRK